MRSRFLRIVLCLFACAAPGKFATAQTRRGSHEIKPLFAQATLRVADEVLKPIRVQYPSRPEFRVGNRRFAVSRTHVVEIDAATGEERWSLKPPDAVQLRWLTASVDVAYLVAEPDPLQPVPPADQNTTPATGRGPKTSIRRLDLRRREWLSSLSSDKTSLRGDFECAIVGPRSLVVLGAAAADDPQESGDAKALKRYAIAYFEDGKDHAVWTKTFSVKGGSQRGRPGAMLWSPTYPDYANSNIQPLSWLGDDVLVCAGELVDLFCLDGIDGHVKWQLPRVWQFERSFIGPSVWSHVVTRFGLDHAIEATSRGDVQFADPSQRKPEEEKAKGALADAAKRFEEEIEAAVVGGPVVVTRQEQAGEWPTRHIFVAVAKGPKGVWAGYLADCVLYELNEDGRPCSLCKLPRTVLGRGFRSLPGSVVWCTQRGGVMRIRLRTPSFKLGDDDALCDLEWYKQFRPASRRAWLVADPLNYVAAFSDRHLFRCISGGYVYQANERIYRFPITEIDLATGASRDLELSVPLEKQLARPSSNVSRVDGNLYAHGTWLMAITGLEVDDAESTLKIVCGLENSSAALEFRIGAEGLGSDPETR